MMRSYDECTPDRTPLEEYRPLPWRKERKPKPYFRQFEKRRRKACT